MKKEKRKSGIRRFYDVKLVEIEATRLNKKIFISHQEINVTKKEQDLKRKPVEHFFFRRTLLLYIPIIRKWKQIVKRN